MRLLVLGGWGQLGSDLAVAARGRHELVRPTHGEVDVTSSEDVHRSVAAIQPSAVVNAAAFHKVEACESDPLRAFAVNACGALTVARAAREGGARCVFVSSDYVFDGTAAAGYAEGDCTAPVNVYGASKVAGERLVQLGCPDSLVVRGSGMFGHAGSAGKGGNFIETMLRKARSGAPISVVDDQVFAPTCTRDMAERILLLLERKVPPGTYHLANAGSCSWYQLARSTFELAGLDADLTPRASEREGVRRPAHSVLLDTQSARLGLPAQRLWEEALEWYLEARPRPDATTDRDPMRPRAEAMAAPRGGNGTA
jgi:dTDP-4-dehydrorhamnose reductase